MKKLLIFLLLPFLIGAAPSRPYSYSTGTTILAAEVNSDLNTLYNYMTLGIDSYLDGSIVNADLHSSANIQSDKLNLAAIAQAVAITSGGSFSNAGDFTQTGTSVTFAGVTIADLGTVTTSILTSTDINGGTLDGVTIGATSAPTVTDLGAVTTADINGGTLDGVQIGGTTATGELIVNNSSDDADGLGSQGTAGQVLTSAGTGANPTFANPVAGDSCFIAYENGTQNTGASGASAMSFDSETLDDGNNFASDTYTVPTTGTYFFTFSTETASIPAGSMTNFYVYVGGSQAAAVGGFSDSGLDSVATATSGSAILSLSASDTVTVYSNNTGSGGGITLLGTSDSTIFSGCRLK